jgi:putative flippase GtrA
VCVGIGAFFMFLTYALVSGAAPPFWASVSAYVICFVVAYLLQRFWTFEAKTAGALTYAVFPDARRPPA